MDILDNAKDLYALIKKIGNQDLLEKMADLRDEIFELREENRKLKEKLSERENYNMQFEKNAYWNIKENGEKEGPFCSACWDKDKKAVHMTTEAGFRFICPVCKTRIHRGKDDNVSLNESSIDWC